MRGNGWSDHDPDPLWSERKPRPRGRGVVTLDERNHLMRNFGLRRRNRGLLMTPDDASRLALWVVLTTLLAGTVLIWAMGGP